MSERLAKKGKVGAEEVTEVINTTFSDLLAVAYQVGGSLLKFGGDSLLLFFSGKDHPLRACHAAGEMRNTLKRTGRIETSAGGVSLKMTVGVNSGAFQFFLVGNSHRELIITGPEATWTVLMESAAKPGEILLSPTTALQLDGSYLGKASAGGRLLVGVPPYAASGQFVPQKREIDASPFIPTAIRKHVALGGGEPEHRQVNVAFLHFGSIDELIATTGLREPAERLQRLISTVQDRVDEYGICFLATDIDKDGGKIILTAGAPQGSENDEERMLRALRQMISVDCGLDLQVGVHRGHVFAGAIGPPYRRTYTVMGDAINTAARMMSKAGLGEILTTGDVLNLSDTIFEVTELPPFSVKGKAKPLVTFRLGERVGARREARKLLPLFGREKEMDLLLAGAEEARSGTGMVVLITGNSGIGKTRLIEELTRTVDMESLVGICEQYEQSTPYFVVRQLLQAVLGIDANDDSKTRTAKLAGAVETSAPHLASWLPLIGVPLGLEIEPTPEVALLDNQFVRQRLNEAVAEFLRSIVGGPKLWLIEDIHWLDDSSRELLNEFVRRASDRPWLVCLTSRQEESDVLNQRANISLQLSPLDEDATIAMARAASEGTLLPQHAAIFAKRSGGHPLFVEQLVAASKTSVDLETLPDSVEKAIAARIDLLSPTDRTALRYMSVIGREFEVGMVPDVVEPALSRDLHGTFHRLADFINISQGFARFNSGVIRDVAYEGLPYRRRRLLHERIGGLMEDRGEDPDEQSELLSLHYHRALNFPKSWRYSRTAAARAQKKFALVAAASFYRRAIECIRHLTEVTNEESAGVWEALGFVLKEGGQFTEAMAALKGARRLAGEKVTRARLALLEGNVRERLGLYASALRWYTRGLNLLQDGDLEPESRKIAVLLMTSRAEIPLYQGRITQAIKRSKLALEKAEALGDRINMGRAYYVLTNAYNDLHDPQAKKFGELALSMFKEEQNLRLQANVLNSLGIEAYFRGEWDEALKLYRESKDALERTGHVLGAAIAANNLAEILSDQAKLEEAEIIFQDALSTTKAAGHGRVIYAIASNLGRAAARAGRFQEASALLQEALIGFRELGDGQNAALTEARIAESRIFAGQPEAGLTLANRILASDPPGLGPLLHRIIGYAHAQAGKLDESRKSLEESLRLAREAGERYEMALSLDALASVSRLRGDDPSPYEAESRKILDQLGVASIPEVLAQGEGRP